MSFGWLVSNGWRGAEIGWFVPRLVPAAQADPTTLSLLIKEARKVETISLINISEAGQIATEVKTLNYLVERLKREDISSIDITFNMLKRDDAGYLHNREKVTLTGWDDVDLLEKFDLIMSVVNKYKAELLQDMQRRLNEAGKE
jgi:hypothetical protein